MNTKMYLKMMCHKSNSTVWFIFQPSFFIKKILKYWEKLKYEYRMICIHATIDSADDVINILLHFVYIYMHAYKHTYLYIHTQNI